MAQNENKNKNNTKIKAKMFWMNLMLSDGAGLLNNECGD